MTVHGVFLLPAEASREAIHVDQLFYGIVAASALVAALVAGLIGWFCWHYRAGNPVKRKPLPKMLEREIEITWTLGTAFAFLALFWWASTLNLIRLTAPAHAMDVRVIAKQWMWKFEQPSGVREINQLHLPIDTPIQLLMTSQDVIHSFYVPAFREKQDILPDRETRVWFTPDKLGTYELKCAEYCGALHSLMKGQVIVMSKADYARWVDKMKSGSLEQQGAALFRKQGCSSCHGNESNDKGPTLLGIYASTIELKDGRKLLVNDTYIRTAITSPATQQAKGWQDRMPAFDTLSDHQIAALVAYIKTLSRSEEMSR